MSDTGSAELLKLVSNVLRFAYKQKGLTLPENRSIPGRRDRIIRDLDCMIIETVHILNEDILDNTPFDSVRGVFIEGDPICEGSEIYTKTHVQIAVRNPNCIKGYFKPLARDNNYPLP